MQSSPFSSLTNQVAALSSWPFDAAGALLQPRAFAERGALPLSQRSLLGPAVALVDSLRALQASGVAAGFDLARSQYAAGVQAGLIKRSLLASGAFERRLGLLERLILGPWARTV
jgi:hypothetical protein